ncbi:MAG: hypothetical protein ACOCUI_04190 [bacterium]
MIINEDENTTSVNQESAYIYIKKKNYIIPSIHGEDTLLEC